MDMRMSETCWAVFKRQVIKLRDWCIWLADLFEYMMMHGSTNPKFTYGVHIWHSLLLYGFNETWNLLTDIWKKYSYFKFHENLSGGNRVVPCRLTDRQTDMTKLIFAFGNFADEAKYEKQTSQVTELTLRLLMSYIYGAPILDVSRSHTTTQHSR